MKITVINGGPRKSGATSRILQSVIRNLEEKEGVEVEFLHLKDYAITECVGCRKCYQTDCCVIKNDQLNKIIRDIKQSDGIVIGSPTYGALYTGMLKSFMDRGNFIVSQSLRGIHALNVITYEIAAGHDALKALNRFSRISGANVSRGIIKKLNFNSGSDKDERFQKLIRKRTAAFYRGIVSSKKRPIPDRIMTYLAVNMVWKPVLLSRKKEFRGLLDNWQKKGLI